MSDALHTRVLMLLALLSGCCALAYEILYMRALTTLLGDMLYVHAALLSTFLIGIALGAKLAHHWVRWLWVFEIATGVYAVMLPRVSAWLSGRELLSDITAAPSLTIAATVALLSLPSLLIGFSIPLFSAYIKSRAPEGLAFQGVYIAYNLGALISILAVEMLLVRWFGITLSLALVGMINVANGIVLLVFKSAPAEVPREAPRHFSRRIVLALALASLASAAFQMFFLKLTYLVFAPHRENFAVALSVTMLGIFVGAWIASRVRVRFETWLLLVPLVIGTIYSLYLPILRLEQRFAPWDSGSEALLLVHKLLFGCLFALGPMILFGALLPALMRTEREVAGESGYLLFVSSMANAAGYLAYVVIGHPALETGALLATLAGLALLASLIAGGVRRRPREALAAAAGAVLVLVMFFQWEDRDFYLAQWVDVLHEDDRVTIFKSGPESATLVSDNDDAWVTYNGHPSIEVQDENVVNLAETISGVIPALGAPRLERALVLGFGTGITSGATARLFDRTDVVEINDAFYKMMPRLAHANLDIQNNPNAELHLSDGRAFLVGRTGVYDAIVNSIPAPTYYSASKIYTVEFYERVRHALKSDGVFCSWLSSANMTEEGLFTILAAMRRSFEFCDLRMMTRGYYMATCSAEPIEPRQFSQLPADLDLILQIQAGLLDFDLNEFFNDIRISSNIFDHFEPQATRDNTDDHPVLEFMVVRGYQIGEMGEDPFLGRQQEMNIEPVRLAELQDSAELVRRAASFYHLGADHFRHNFLPLLQDDPQTWDEWLYWGFDEDPND